MNETLWNAVFAWGVTACCLYGAVRVTRSREPVPWYVAVAILLAFFFAGLALVIGTTFFYFAHQPTVGTALGAPVTALRGVSAAIGLGVVLYFIAPSKWGDKIERVAGKTYRRLGALLGRLL